MIHKAPPSPQPSKKDPQSVGGVKHTFATNVPRVLTAPLALHVGDLHRGRLLLRENRTNPLGMPGGKA